MKNGTRVRVIGCDLPMHHSRRGVVLGIYPEDGYTYIGAKEYRLNHAIQFYLVRLDNGLIVGLAHDQMITE